MDVTPSDPTPNRPKPKAKAASAPKSEPLKKAAAIAPAKTKKARVAREPVTPQPTQTFATTIEVVNAAGLSLTDLQHEIAIAAYFLAEQRNFAAGHELDDWLQAERQVREQRAV